MALDIWSSAELYQLLEDNRRDPLPSHFLDTYYTGIVTGKQIGRAHV